MKKTLLLFLAAAAMTLAGATTASAQVSLGAGPATRIHFQKAWDVTYAVGVQVNFEDSQRVSDNFGYSAGVDFGTYKMKDFRPGIAMTEMYVDLPIRAKFYVPCSSDIDLFFFGGIVPSACVSSHLKTESTNTNRFKEDPDYSRYDVMAGGGIGVELAERFKLALGYDHGLLDRYKDGRILHVASVKFTVSYLF